MNETVLLTSRVTLRTWLAVIALGISTFTIVTSELAPVGMLSLLAGDLHQTESTAGLMVTAYGWVGALAALLSAFMPARFSRKRLLVVLMLVLACASLLAAESSSLGLFLTARIAGAVAHGVFWALIGSVTTQLVAPEKMGLATSIVFGGVSVASVVGVPLASLIAQFSGWREAFTAIAWLSLFTACALWWTLPSVAAPTAINMSQYRRIFRSPVMPALYALTACIITAHFAAFTYVQPLLTQIQGVSASAVSALLLLSGVSGVVGNIIAGKLIDRHLKRLLVGALLISVLALVMLTLPHRQWFSTVLLMLWGGAIAVIFVGLQTWVLRSAGDAVQPASAIYVAIFNAAIGCGALAGGLLLTHYGLRLTLLFAALMMLISTLLLLRLRKS